jgi:hypothetical protein
MTTTAFVRAGSQNAAAAPIAVHPQHEVREQPLLYLPAAR